MLKGNALTSRNNFLINLETFYAGEKLFIATEGDEADSVCKERALRKWTAEIKVSPCIKNF